MTRIKTPNRLPEELSDFIKALSRFDNGFDPYAVLAHAWLESGGFRRVVGKYNYWRIKPDKDWHGKIVIAKDSRFVKTPHGIKRKFYKNKFVDFESASQALQWYFNYIKDHYVLAFVNRRNPYMYFEHLKDWNSRNPDSYYKLLKDTHDMLQEKGVLSVR